MNNKWLQVFAAEVPGEATEEEEDEDIYEQPSRTNAPASIYRNNLLQRKLSNYLLFTVHQCI